MSTLQTIEAVANELARRGFAATFEYPGFIAVRKPGFTIDFGTSNEKWDGDIETLYDAGTVHTDVPSDCDDVKRIADALERAILETASGHPELSVTSRQIFGNVTDAMEHAEGMYGPEDYAELMQAIADEALQRIRNYRDWNETEGKVNGHANQNQERSTGSTGRILGGSRETLPRSHGRRFRPFGIPSFRYGD